MQRHQALKSSLVPTNQISRLKNIDMNKLLNGINFKRSLRVSLPIMALSLFGCDGGSNSGGDKAEPTTTLTSPTYSRTTTNSVVTISGSSYDEHSGIESVTVNGEPVTSDDNYANWRVDLPTEPDIGELNINTIDGAGNKREDKFDLRVTRIDEIFEEPSHLAITSDNKLLISDANKLKTYATDINSPRLTLYAANDSESLIKPQTTVFDTNQERELILDVRETQPVSQAILARQYPSGNLTTLANGLNNVIDISIDSDGGILYLLMANENSESGAIIKVFDIDEQLSPNRWPILSDNANPGLELLKPTAIVFHNGVLYCSDNGNNTVLSIDIETGTSSIISSSEQGSASGSFSYISDIAAGVVEVTDIDQELTTKTKLWLIDEDSKSIIEIDVETGDRTILSQANDGKGEEFKTFKQLVVDQQNERLLVNDTELKVVFSVAFSSGQRELFVSNRYGSGPNLEAPTSIQHIGNNMALITEGHHNALFEVDLQTGSRKVISASNSNLELGSGPAILNPVDLEINASQSSVWVSMREQKNIWEIDLASGDRNLITPSPRLGATELKLPSGLALKPESNQLLVSDIYLDRIQSVNLNSYETDIAANKRLSRNSTSKLSKPSDITYDQQNTSIYAVDSALNAVIRWNAESENAEIVSSIDVGSGLNLLNPIAIDLNLAQNTAYIADQKLKAIISVDLSSGDREVLSNRAIGSGPLFKNLTGLSFNPDSNSLLVTDSEEKAIFAVDINNGNRNIISK